ncbi:MAG: FtsH protease activity modulator HflK [Thiohalomonadales bacterium]
MAWNEPGGSGKKDPWGGGNGNQGPPDLDEVVKKMQQKFSSIFGGGGGKSTSGGGGLGSMSIGLIAIVAVIAWALSGIYIIKEGTRGVVLQFGAYSSTTMPGPHWYPRFIQSVETVNIEEIRTADIGYRSSSSTRNASTKVERESLMLTQDENIIDVQMAVQYKVKSASDYLFKVKGPDLTLRTATESAIREIIGKNKMDFILTEGRAEISSQVRELIQRILDKYSTGLLVISVNLQDAQPPEQVQGAFEDAVKAREDNERLKNEAQAYANDILPRASGKSARLIAESNAYREQVIAKAEGETVRFNKILVEYQKAPEVTRKRLYLESMESVMENSSKVMVDVKGNNILYLPLDRAAGSGGNRNIIPPPVEMINPTASTSSSSRGRESVRRGSR